MDHLHQPTALQVLETDLLHHRFIRKRTIRHRKTRQNKTEKHTTIFQYPLLAIDKSKRSEKSNEHDVEACIASFGPESPLCKTRLEIKRKSRELRRKCSVDPPSDDFFPVLPTVLHDQFIPPGHVKRSFTKQIPVVEDFFGLFSTCSTNSSLVSQIQTVKSTPCPGSTAGTSVTSHTSNKTTGILFPGNIAKLRDTQSLFLDDSLSGEDSEEVDHEQPSSSSETESPMSTEASTNQSQEPLPTELSSSEEPNFSLSQFSSFSIPKTTQSSHLENMSNEKQRCFAEHGKNCVCSFGRLVQDIHDIFSKGKSPKETFDKVFHVRCVQYVPVPGSFELSSNVKPRVLSANMKPMPLDSDKGPKELSEKSLEDFLDHLAAEEVDTSRAFVNTVVRLPCFPMRNVHLSPSGADHVTYTWSHGNKEAITEGRVSENADADGTLAIEDVAVADTDNYTCAVSYTDPDTGHRTESQYEHTLTVVALPVVTVRVTIHYLAPVTCDAGLLEMMELYLPQQLEESVCQGQGLCTIQLHSPMCYSQPAADEERVARSVESNSTSSESEEHHPSRNSRGAGGDSLMMSLNYEVYMHRQGVKALTAGNNTFCDPTCHLLLTFRLIQIFHDSMSDIVLTPVISKVANVTGIFSPQQNTLRLRYIFGCVGGYRLEGGFCVACERGHYSEDGWTECLPCPPRTYMGRPGARRCISCHSRWILYCNEYAHTNNILMIIGVVAAAALFVACLVLYYNIAKKGRKLAAVMKNIKSKKPHRRAKLGKSQKRRMSPSKVEMQLLMEETTEDESDTDEKK